MKENFVILISIFLIAGIGMKIYQAQNKKGQTKHDPFIEQMNSSSLAVKNGSAAGSDKAKEQLVNEANELLNVEFSAKLTLLNRKAFKKPEELMAEVYAFDKVLSKSTLTSEQKFHLKDKLMQGVSKKLESMNLPKIVDAHFDKNTNMVYPEYR